MAGKIKRSCRILIVDDDEQVLAMTKTMVERIGHNVVAKSDSKEALNLFQGRPDQFDIIFTDLHMPKMNGIDLSRSILKVRPDLPIILCTGYPIDKERSKAIQVGIKSFLLKPFSTKDVVSAFEKLL